MKRYLEVGIDAGFAGGAYYFFGWIGLAVWAIFLFGWYATQMISNQRIMTQTLLSRLPDRCAFCHREIVDEGGEFDEEGVYHAACAAKLESLEGLRKEAGVPYSEAIHRPRVRPTPKE
jgi:hypothetical protein